MSDAHVLDPTILREYDIRGVVDEDFSAIDVAAIGWAFATIVKEGGGSRVAVGYDGRLSSPGLEQSMVAGLSLAGVDVLRVGLGPSPMLYYAGATEEVDAAVMITGSHNPPEYNGIKMSIGGNSFYGDDIQRLGKICASGDFVQGNEPGNIESTKVFTAYVERILSDYRGTKNLKVAWDPANGAAGEAVSELVKKLPGQHFLINEKIDGNFPAHHPDPTVEKNLEQLKALVAENECDLGFGFDGDGDRIGVIDGKGRVLWGDQIMVLLAREVLADEPGATIIADVKASQAFFDAITEMGGNPIMWKTGHSLIKTKMVETGAPLAGEMSAHIFFKHRYYGFDDALYAAVRLLSIVASSDKSLADMRDELPQMINTPEIRFDCPEERKFAVVDEVKSRLQGREGISVNDIDGVRVLSDDGWWLLRASNTQAVLVARCESESEEGLARLKSTLSEELEKSGVSVPDLG
ncbi:MAG: phosphomannomutase/phosphoglucomutase [Rhodospirillaceae bacterium]|nr:phosphomannomutase/phosphoglucomutase [Rhodospirillaceae bacterium]